LQRKLPWIKVESFEKWFWTTSKRSWIDSSSAASVLARRYMSRVRKKMSWSKTTAEIEAKVDPSFRSCLVQDVLMHSRSSDPVDALGA